MTDKENEKRDLRQETGADSIRAAAADWFETLNGGEMPPEETESLKSWLHADPAHAKAFQELEQTWRDLALLDDIEKWVRHSEPASAVALPVRKRILSQPVIWAAMAACLGLMVIPLVFIQGDRPVAIVPASVVYATGTAETRMVDLEDASKVNLSAESRIEVSYTPQSRNVVLTRGVAYFEVSPNPDRPFVVVSANTRVTVVGTAFEIWRGPDAVRVSVGRGRVEVAPDQDAPNVPVTPTILTAGDQVTSTLAGGLGTTSSFDPGETLAWRRGRFIYSSVPLRTMITDINRYRSAKIVLSDPSLGDMQVTAAFSIQDIDDFLEGFAEAEGFRITKLRDQTVFSKE